MNRLAPLIHRAATLRPLPARAAAAPMPDGELDLGTGGDWQSDLQFFVTAWLGGLLFVGTLIG